MALIGSIRKNGWILIVLMALALGGFILMEFISNIERNRAGGVNTIGKVNGQEIRYDEFNRYEQLIYQDPRNPYQARTQVWNYFVERVLIGDIAKELGLGVPKDELKELQFGDNLSPIIAERFKDESNKPNLQRLMQIKAAIEGGQLTDARDRAYWAEQEKEIVKQRLQDKLTNLIGNSMYTPGWQAEMAYRETNERLDFAYVRVPYDKVPDTEIKLTDDDYRAYLKEHPGLYDQTEETRMINFIAMDVVPTPADSAVARDGVAKLIEGLRTAPSDSAFAAANNGVYDGAYRQKAELPASMADTMLKVPVGTVIGPFFEAGNWAIAKVIDRKVVPDSVSARHILIRGEDPDAEKKIDSLRALIESGRGRFDSLAVRNSQDGSAAKGGDLGYMANGRTVPEFNNVLFNIGEQGKLYKVATQFGWHLIEITGKKFVKNEAAVKAVFISLPVEPSTPTERAAEDRLADLVQQAKTGADLLTLATQQGLQVQTSPALKANDFAIGQTVTGEGVRALVQWAFKKETKVDNVSKEVFGIRKEGQAYVSQFVVASLKSIAPAGEATVETLKAQPRAETEIKNRKKAEVIKSKIQNATDLAALATQWSVPVDTAKGATFFQGGSPALGQEPRIFGLAFSLAKGAVGGPVAGNSGVFVVMPVSDRIQPPAPANFENSRSQVSSQAASMVRMTLMTEIKKKSDLRDNRSNFF